MLARFLSPWGGSKLEPSAEPGDVLDLDADTFKFLLGRRMIEAAPDAIVTVKAAAVPEAEPVSDFVEKPKKVRFTK